LCLPVFLCHKPFQPFFSHFCAEELCDMAFSCTLMEDPVVASDGHTYNRQDIQNWFKTHNTSPHTNEPFEDKVLRPNIAIRRQVIAWREKHGLPVAFCAAPYKAQAAGGSAAADRILKPAAICSFSKQPLQVFCITCDKAVCVSCAIDPSRCKPHNLRQLDSIVSSVRDAHAAWLLLRDGRPQQLQAETDRVDAAANAAIESFTREVRREQAELKLELHRVCIGDLEATLQEQAQLLADVELAVALPEAAVAGSEACRCLRTAATRGQHAPVEGAGCGRFEAVAGGGTGGASGAGAGSTKTRRLGRIVLVQSVSANIPAPLDNLKRSSATCDLPVVCTAQQGKGMEVRGLLARRGGETVYDMVITNQTQQPLSDFAIQFNKNLFSIMPGTFPSISGPHPSVPLPCCLHVCPALPLLIHPNSQPWPICALFFCRSIWRCVAGIRPTLHGTS
jgi:hypothetical protein